MDIYGKSGFKAIDSHQLWGLYAYSVQDMLDLLASRVPVAGAITMDKGGEVKAIQERLLVKDTRRDETKNRLLECGTKCDFCKK